MRLGKLGALLGSLAAAVVLVAVCAGAAGGHTAVAAKRKPKGYQSKGHSSIYATQGQVCFIGTWQGNGKWSTDYKDTSSTGTTVDNDSSTYSWDAKTGSVPGVCGFIVLRGYKPHPNGGWGAGFLRMAVTGDDSTPSSGEVKCNNALLTHGSGPDSTGSFTTEIHGNSLVFTATVELGDKPQVPPGCASDALPDAITGGKNYGPFLSSSSVAIPISLFRIARTVSMTLSSDKSRVPHPNCGLSTSDGAGGTVECEESGSWQGTLTFTVYHG